MLANKTQIIINNEHKKLSTGKDFLSCSLRYEKSLIVALSLQV